MSRQVAELFAWEEVQELFFLFKVQELWNKVEEGRRQRRGKAYKNRAFMVLVLGAVMVLFWRLSISTLVQIFIYFLKKYLNT